MTWRHNTRADQWEAASADWRAVVARPGDGGVWYSYLEEDHSAAIYRWAKQPEPIDTTRVAELARRPIPAARWWPLPTSDGLELVAPAVGPSGGLPPEHVARVTIWLIYEPNISTRELARRLYPGTDGGGRYAVRAKEIRELAEQVLLDTVPLLPAMRNTAEVPPRNT